MKSGTGRNAAQNRIWIKIGNAVTPGPFRRIDPASAFKDFLQILKRAGPLHDKRFFRSAGEVDAAFRQILPGGGFPIRPA